MTCPSCQKHLRELDSLRRQVRQLRSQLELPTEDVSWTIQRTCGVHLTPQEADTLTLLYAAKGAVVAREYLYDNIPATGERTADSRLLPTIICRLRQKLGRHIIENMWGKGYCLTPRGVALVDDLRQQALDRTTGRA